MSSFFIQQFGGNAAANATGLAAVNKARAAGWSDDRIRNELARSGTTVGEAARASLAATAGNQLRSFSQDPVIGAGIGVAGIDRALAAGWDDARIKKALITEGLELGPKAVEYMQLRADEQAKADAARREEEARNAYLELMNRQAEESRAQSKAMLDSLNAQTQAFLTQAKSGNDEVTKQITEIQDRIKNRVSPTAGITGTTRTPRLRGIFNPVSTYDQQRRQGRLRGDFNSLNFYDRDRLANENAGLFESLLNKDTASEPADTFQVDNSFVNNPNTTEEVNTENPFDDPNFGFSDPWSGISIG